jgi:hypothetical protein
MMQRDLARISATCSILTEQFRENGLSFDLLVSHGSTGRFECRLDIKRHVEDVEVEHVTLDVDKYTGKEVASATLLLGIGHVFASVLIISDNLFS